MIDYLSKSSSKISDKSDEKHNDLKNSPSTSAIMTSSLKRKDQVPTPEDVASNTLTSETAGYAHHQKNIKTSIHWLSTHQNYLHFEQQNASNPSSSNQVGPNFQRRSIVHRHVSPHPPLTKQGNTNVDDFKSLRKTKSLTLPTITNVPRYRDEPVSTLDLKIDQCRNEYVSISTKGNIRRRRMYTVCALTYSMPFIQISLDCIVSVAGFIHLALAVVLSIYKDTILTVIKQEIYTLIRTSFIIVSIMLLVFSIIAIYFLHKGQKRRATHAACSLIVAIIILFFASMQNKIENNVLKNIESNLLSMINSETRYFPSSTWDKFHEIFKCCGAKGNLDWCEEEKSTHEMNLKEDKLNFKNFIGFYICNIPKSCCASSINEYNVSTTTNSLESCLLFPTPWNTYRPGCMTPLKLEVFHMNKLYRVLSFTTVTILLLSMSTSIFLCTFP